MRNAARLLKEFSRSNRELGITQLARRLGLAPSTVHRLVKSLAEEGLLEGAEGGRYRLGLQIYELGTAVLPSLDLYEAARPVLASLRHSTGETVQMGVLDCLDVVHVERLESPQTLRVFDHTGHRFPAHCTASGKVLLAYLPHDVLAARLLDWRPVRITPRTITNRRALLAELARVAEQGWAENLEESALGAASVAAPVRAEDGEVIAAISVVGPISRARRALARHRAAVIQAANLISTRTGYRSDTGRT